jgi:hypothetical protein
MPLANAVAEVSAILGIDLHDFGRAHHAIHKEAVYRQIRRYRQDHDKLIRNFTNLCKRSRVVYFDLKPPTDEDNRGHVFLPHSLIENEALVKIGDGYVALYLYFWVVRTEEALSNRFKLPVLSHGELEEET